MSANGKTTFNGNLKDIALWRGVAAELLGTAFVVFAITAAMENNPRVGGAGAGSVPLVTGFAYAAAIYFARGYSDGHLNPVTSLVAFALSKIHVVQLGLFSLAHMVGAIVGSTMLRIARDGQHDRLGTPQLWANSTNFQGFWWEFVGTLFVLLVIVETSYNERRRAGNIAPFAQGLAYYVSSQIAMQWTTGVLNPVRAFGPALIADKFDDSHWIYWVGPYTAAVVAIVLSLFLFAVAPLPKMGGSGSRNVANNDGGAPMRPVEP